jgi:hypothetical protein
MRKLLFSMIILSLIWSSQIERRARASDDTVKIASITSSEPVHRGVENEFTVDVDYNLDSSDEGIIMLGFNSQDPNQFVMMQSKIVQKGSGTATLKAKVIPVDWRDRGRFTAMVNISKYPHEESWHTLATDKHVIPVKK